MARSLQVQQSKQAQDYQTPAKLSKASEKYDYGVPVLRGALRLGDGGIAKNGDEYDGKVDDEDSNQESCVDGGHFECGE